LDVLLGELQITNFRFQIYLMKRLQKPDWQQKREKRKKFRVGLLRAFLLIPLTIGVVFGGNYLFSEDKITVSGATIFVRAGGDLQAALDRARGGDTIVLQAGASFTGSFILPNKTGSEFITIQSSELAKLPKDGMRVGPQDAALMPKILSVGKGEPAIKTAPSAHHYRFVGIEIAPANADYIYNLVYLGTDNQTSAEMPNNFEFDRCYIHQNPKGITRRGIALNVSGAVVKNSYLSDFSGKEQETQAIAAWNGAGNFRIFNNYLEAATENIMIGGSDREHQKSRPDRY
jgi:hypothetical protein